MAVPGLSTLGVLFGYGVETTAGTIPTTFNLLTRINSIGEIALDTETIDASALEDLATSSVAGRQDSGGTLSVTINLTDDTVDEWETVISAYNALTDSKQMWFEVYHPDLTKAFYIVGQPPQMIPQPAFDQNGLLTVTITITIVEYKGLLTAVTPS